MKALPYEARIPNIDDHPKWREEVALCDHCGDTGVVVAMLRRHGEEFIEEMAPCPYCQLGYNTEFKTNTWGREGYWQGRSQAALQPMYPNGTKIEEPGQQHARATAYITRNQPPTEETPATDDLF